MGSAFAWVRARLNLHKENLKVSHPPVLEDAKPSAPLIETCTSGVADG